MHILVTGGTGYIGSHTIVQLIAAGHTVMCIDNLSNSSQEVLPRLKQITGVEVPFLKVDVRDEVALDSLFNDNQFDAVIHFAGLKAVGESAERPLLYYYNNVVGTVNLLNVMNKHSVKNIIFSSSATVYGAAPIPYEESMTTGRGLANVYARTKYTIEQMINDLAVSDNDWQVTILRYFNPIGAHPSGLIGEQPQGAPNNLMPIIAQVAAGVRDTLHIYGNDYPTADGTCERDYVHVMDLADGHVAALAHMMRGVRVYNLGTGKSTSVFALIDAFQTSTGATVAYVIDGRRAGDLPAYYAAVDKAHSELGWAAKRTTKDACRDTWRWQTQNPHGYVA